jgi:alpha-D-xyloside xylohydrolase
MSVFVQGNRLVRTFDSEILWVEPWGPDAVRVRATSLSGIDESRDWALLPPAPAGAEVSAGADEGIVVNGAITARLHPGGRLTFTDASGREILAERWRTRRMKGQSFCAIEVAGRELKPLTGGSYRITARFEAHEDERLYGMGQYQDGRLDLKGSTLELAQRNSQASVPFLVSSRGYGLLWNNPAIGHATFGANLTEIAADVTAQLDYWVTAGDTPALIVERYASATGTVPLMPEYGLGFWQCKLRYRTQEELLRVAREHKRRGLPLSVIVSDFFHWTMQGDYSFDPRHWPDPDAMVRELKGMGVELMVSVWPTIDTRCARYQEMLEKGFLVRTERGVRAAMDFIGKTGFFDPTNPACGAYIWDAVREGYWEKGIRIFWLDLAEPELAGYDFDHFRYWLGSVPEVGNWYPVAYARLFHDGMTAAGQERVLNLARCAWAGCQRYGVLAWSGDIDTTWESFRRQLPAGLNMGMAGIPWWTTDIGGFGGGDPDDPAYRELFIRWFQWGAFCPVFRVHGFRDNKSPDYVKLHPSGVSSDDVFSGGPNEVWSYGDEAYAILSRYLFLRERMKPYIRELMRAAHEKGTPVMRPLFHDFPSDARAWTVEDEYLFGPGVLVAPVLWPGMRTRRVYLPAGASWKHALTGTTYPGGAEVEVEAPLEEMPVFTRDGAEVGLERGAP